MGHRYVCVVSVEPASLLAVSALLEKVDSAWI